MKPNFFTKETILDFDIKDRGFPKFNFGDTIEVAQKVVEGEKARIQMFKGDVIGFHKKGIATTFIVRRLSADGIYVEKIFPYYSPMINDIKIVKRGDVRRAKLYYLRDKIGKAAKIKEKIVAKQKKEIKNNKIKKAGVASKKDEEKPATESVE